MEEKILIFLIIAFLAIALFFCLTDAYKIALLFSVLTNGCLIILVDTNYETKD